MVDMKMTGMCRSVVAAVLACGVGLLLAGLVGCKGDAAPSGAGPVKAVAIDPATLGSVSGVVSFAGKAPKPVKIDTSMVAGCGVGGVYSEQYVVHDGKLANVYVYVKSVQMPLGQAMVSSSLLPAPPAVIDQKGCVYTPHVIAVEQGDSVEFRNDDATVHNVHTMPMGNQPVDFSQGPKGAPQTVQFKQPETMIPVRCDYHPWMNAFINVSATPWFAVTGADGSFTLKGMPAGVYTIGAVQEKMGEQDVTVTVKPPEAVKADFSFAMK
jgi:plastocyanin